LITSARGPVMQNFMQISPRGASRQMGEIYAKIFIYALFSSTHPQVKPLK